MNTNNSGELITVDSLRAGTTCPACLKQIEEGEVAMICNKCGSLNHEICWQRQGCGSYHCQTGNSRTFSSDAVDIVITKNDLESLKELPRNARHGTAAIAHEMAKRQETGWAPLSIVALVFGMGALGVSLINLTTDSSSEGQMGYFLIAAGGCVLSILLGALSAATFHNNSGKKGLLFSFVGMGGGILAMILTVYPLINSPEGPGESFKLDMKQVAETIRTASPGIRGPLMANVHIKSGSGLRAGTGSGITLCNRDNFTYILTNAHVLSLGASVSSLSALERIARDIEVTFYSGETVKGTPIWLAPDKIDLVLLRVTTPAGFVPTLKYQRGRPLTMGQRVFAIGNPVGLNWTYTEGVISALRKNSFGTRDLTVVQIQTPLNHGNSGGGLYDLDGYLIGVNTWIYAKTVTEGLNFSIAIDEFFQLLEPEWAEVLALPGLTLPAEKENQE
ncbi:MAG: hypothetical protein GQF41_1514 [Candidatus Rifleibacterium amylolyticum]|nr:MAG: hypothetical protein GQF41_1514 [Candidatus Rifleibacterium amylolyticum]